MSSIHIPDRVLKIYVYYINAFEEKVKNYNVKKPKNKGYLINLNDYNELKNKIKYEKNKILKNPNTYEIDEKDKIIIKDLDFKTNQYLINMILNRNKYIIIDFSLWKIICSKDKEKITPVDYEIDNNNNLLTLNIKGQKPIKFVYKMDNILEESKLKNNLASNFEKIKKTYLNIKYYYDFEIIVEKELKNKKEKKNKYKGYLIEKEWIDKWKEKIEYDTIKKDFLLPKKSEKEARDKLIYQFEKNKLKYMDINEIKNKELNTSQKIQDFLKTNSLVLVSDDFISSFGKFANLKEINFSLYENIIEIIFDSNSSLIFNLKDNVIVQNQNSDIKENNKDNKKEDKNNTNENNQLDNNFAENIITILLYLNLGGKELSDNIENSKSKINKSIYDYSLIDSKQISDLTQFFDSDGEIERIINEYKIKSISEINSQLMNKIKTNKKSYFDKLSNQQKDFSNKFSAKKLFDIKSDKQSHKNCNVTYKFPIEIQFVQKKFVEKIYEIFEKKENINIEEIKLGFNSGNLIVRPEKGKFFDEGKNYTYIYSVSQENKDNIKIEPEVLIAFNTKESFINNFQKLIEDYSLISSCINNTNHINETYKCKMMLINKENTKLNMFSASNSEKNNNDSTNKGKVTNISTENKNNIEEENINKYLIFSITFIDEYIKLKTLIGEKNNSKDYDCYLINKNLIETIENILCIKDINDILKAKKELIKNFKGEKEQIENIKKELKFDNIIKELKKLDDKKIEEKIKPKQGTSFNLVKSYMDKTTKKEFYYENCKIISCEIFEIIKGLAKNYIDQIKHIKCIFDKGQIIILIKDEMNEIINIGNLDKENDVLIVEKVLKEGNLQDIFSRIKYNGYDYFKSNILANKTQSQVKENNNNSSIKINPKAKSEKNNNLNQSQNLSGVKSKSESIKKEENKNNQLNRSSISSKVESKNNKPTSNTNNLYKNEAQTNNVISKEVKIGEKLKSLILLAVNQKKDYTVKQYSYNMKISGHKVYLINKDLEKYKYNEIISQLNSSKFDTLITSINQTNIPTSQINEIIKKLDKEKLKQLNDNMDKITLSPTFKWDPKTENIKLINLKIIKAYTEFIIATESTYNQLKTNFKFVQDNKPVYYIHINTGGDIIYFDNILLYGNIDKNKNTYEIKYIFEFDKISDLENEIKEIQKSPETYIRFNCVFIDNNKDDIISPIYSSSKTIGTIYKYKSQNDYSKCVDYKKYIKNEKLSKFISLYNFYSETSTKIGKGDNCTEKYYLIKPSAISDIKNMCDYDEIKQIFDDYNIKVDTGTFKDEKKIIKILKTMPKNIIEKNFSSNYGIKKFKADEMKSDMKTVTNPNNNNDYAMFYNNFIIIDKSIGDLFIEGGYSCSSYEQFCFDCTLNNGKILIDYQNSIGNPKYVSIIGSVDPTDFSIINEYALIYKDSAKQKSNDQQIKNKLNNYIQGFKLFNGTQPIIDSLYNEIGTIIQIEEGNTPRTNPQPIPRTDPQPNPPFTPKPPTPYRPNPPRPDEYNLDSKIFVTSIRQYFTYPPLIGLENIGATCYMNATLQCFCSIEKFVDYFKYNKHLINTVKIDVNKSKLCSSFKLLIEKLWPDNFMSLTKKYYAPYDFKDNISSKDPLFQGVQANDSKDLVNFIIMTLHGELNKIKTKSMNINNPSIEAQRNQQFMLNNFIQNFQAENKSIISDLFYAMNCNIIQCFGCKSQTFNYQTYFFIIFPLEEVRKYKLNNFNQFNNMYNNNEVNIYECFEYEKKINYMTGQNAMHCNYCQRTCDSSMYTVLTTGPEVLIIILNRGKGIEFNVKINFVEQLNLANYIQFGNTGVNYELIGVITHMGESSMSGHFIAYCKNPISKTWYQYNDAMVNPVNNFKAEVIDYATPYLLFYQKMH